MKVSYITVFLLFNTNTIFFIILGTLGCYNFFNPSTIWVFIYSIEGLFSKFFFFWNTSLIFTILFLIFGSLLILIRGGSPRYRLDYITKVGWLKFLGFLVMFIVSQLFLNFFI